MKVGQLNTMALLGVQLFTSVALMACGDSVRPAWGADGIRTVKFISSASVTTLSS
jgi:hypothetical protein